MERQSEQVLLVSTRDELRAEGQRVVVGAASVLKENTAMKDEAHNFFKATQRGQEAYEALSSELKPMKQNFESADVRRLSSE